MMCRLPGTGPRCFCDYMYRCLLRDKGASGETRLKPNLWQSDAFLDSNTWLEKVLQRENGKKPKQSSIPDYILYVQYIKQLIS